MPAKKEGSCQQHYQIRNDVACCFGKYNYSCLHREKQIMVSEETLTSGLLKKSSVLVVKCCFIPLILESLLCARYYYKHVR